MSNHRQFVIRWPSRQQWEKIKQRQDLEYPQKGPTEKHSIQVLCDLISSNGKHLKSTLLDLNNLKKTDDIKTVTVLLHPKDVSTLLSPRTLKKNKPFSQAIAFAVEPHLLEDIETLYINEHPFPNTAAENETITQSIVTAVKRSWIQLILKTLNELGLRVKQFVIEPLFYIPQLQSNNTHIWLIKKSDHIWVCSTITAPWAIVLSKQSEEEKDKNQENLTAQCWQLLNHWADQNQFTLKNGLTVITEKISETREWLTATTNIPIETVGFQSMILSKKIHAIVPADLLQKQNLKTNKHPFFFFGNLRLAVAASVFCVIALNLKAWQLEHEIQVLNHAIESTVSTALPNTPIVVDPLLMLEFAHQKINQKNNTNKATWTQLLHHSAMALSNLPFNASSAIRYEQNTLHLEFSPKLSEEQKQTTLNALQKQQLIGKWQQNTSANAVLSITPASK